MKRSTQTLFLLVAIVFSGCVNKTPLSVQKNGPPISTGVAEEVPISFTSMPTVVPVVTVEPSASATSEKLLAQVLTLEPTKITVPENSPTQTYNQDSFLIKIIAPGPMSKVASPVEFVFHVAPDVTGITRIELIGENGEELYRKIFKTYSNVGYYTRITEQIEFAIRGVAEIARLQVSTYNAEGQLLALNSVRLLLQSVGENEFTPVENYADRLHLRAPKRGSEIANGLLAFTGEYLPINELPVTVELLDASGSIISSRQLQFNVLNGKFQSFETIIPFKVIKKIDALIVFRQSDNRIKGLAYVFSRKVILIP